MDNQDLARSAFDSLEDGEAKALRLVRTMDERGEAINTLTIKREHPDPVPLDRIKPRGYILSDLRSFVRYCEHFIDDKNKAIVFAEGERFVLVEDPMAEFGMQGHYHAAYFNIKEHPYFISWHKNMNVFLKHEPLLETFKFFANEAVQQALTAYKAEKPGKQKWMVDGRFGGRYCEKCKGSLSKYILMVDGKETETKIVCKDCDDLPG